jgi:hypothetical protein
MGDQFEKDPSHLKRIGPAAAQQDAEEKVKAKLRDDRRAASTSNKIWAMGFVHERGVLQCGEKSGDVNSLNDRSLSACVQIHGGATSWLERSGPPLDGRRRLSGKFLSAVDHNRSFPDPG